MENNNNEIKGIVKKESFFQKAMKAFMDIPDEVSILDYVIYEKFIPGIKYTIIDTLNIFFFGKTGGSRPSGNNGMKVRVSYNGVNEQTNYNQPRRMNNSGGSYKFDGILLPSQQMAQNLIGQVKRVIANTDGCLTINELYEMANIQPEKGMSNPLDSTYGWTNVEGIYPRRYDDTYWEVVFPRPVKVK